MILVHVYIIMYDIADHVLCMTINVDHVWHCMCMYMYLAIYLLQQVLVPYQIWHFGSDTTFNESKDLPTTVALSLSVAL